ncbi:MAG: hypothetical protein IIA44_04605 [Acidobacteria bacterium]|nr:hypothetical protein [Acidobacteriota bacterium]
MSELTEPTSGRHAIVLYYSAAARNRLVSDLRAHDLDVTAIDGREPDAVDAVRKHPVGLVVIDDLARDISVRQAVQHVGRMLPDSLLITVGPECQKVDVYKGGNRVGEEESLGLALRRYMEPLNTEPSV